MGRIDELLASALEEGRDCIGQIALRTRGESGYRLTHRDDVGRDDLRVSQTPESAREIATYDDAGVYRPLKTAPNLRHGWALHLPDLAAVRAALEYFYPAALALWLAERDGRLQPTAMRETLGRQTGMYRVTGLLTDPQAEALVGELCAQTRCLRAMRWTKTPGGERIASLPPTKFEAEHDPTGAGARVMPLLCAEMCNLVVAEARPVVKAAQAAAAAAASPAPAVAG